MNIAIETMLNHRSLRNYKDEPIPEPVLDMIIQAAQAAPSWINGQHVSIIVVKDKQRKKKLSELTGNQAHVDKAPVFLVFCVDFYRAGIAAEMEGYDFVIPNEIDSILIGATDAGIMLGNAITAAESLGLGIIPIGGIRRNPLEVIELLELPKYVFPLCGLCIGYGADSPLQKPRLPKESVVHHETYNHEIKGYIEAYNPQISNYNLEKSNGELSTNWTQRIAKYYSTQKYKSIYKMLKQQGYNVEKEK
ncbi:NADPH-dependent oxidoreductase [Neobacillus niacini]|uniref:NADPH-dependent oxidoreductase n=1 Tax=Neobacillus niacini TaxID=86668 RepID=UPI0027D7F374|nr:NADPH-dependent oxidoreductase [Neobacillus niacini]